MPLKRIIWVVVRPGLYDGKTGQTCRLHFVSPACSRATIIDCSMRSLSTNPRKSSWYTVRSGSWNVHRGVSRSASLVLPPVLETWERAKDTMVELAWEMPLDSLFSVVKKKKKRNKTNKDASQSVEYSFRLTADGSEGDARCRVAKKVNMHSCASWRMHI